RGNGEAEQQRLCEVEARFFQLRVVPRAQTDGARAAEHVAVGNISNAARPMFGVVITAVTDLEGLQLADFHGQADGFLTRLVRWGGLISALSGGRLNLLASDLDDRVGARVIQVPAGVAELLQIENIARLDFELGADQVLTRVAIPCYFNLPD